MNQPTTQHTPGPWKIIRTNKPDEPDAFAVVGPGGVCDDGYTSSDSALRSALGRANESIRTSIARMFSYQSAIIEHGESVSALVRGAELLDDYCMGGSRPINYDLPTIRAILNDAANDGRRALSAKIVFDNDDAIKDRTAIAKATGGGK